MKKKTGLVFIIIYIYIYISNAEKGRHRASGARSAERVVDGLYEGRSTPQNII